MKFILLLLIGFLIFTPISANAQFGSSSSVSTQNVGNLTVVNANQGENGIAANLLKTVYEGLDYAVWDKMYPNLVKPVQKILRTLAVLWLVFYALNSYFGQPLNYGLIIKQLAVITLLYYFLGTEKNVVISWTYDWLITTFYGFSAWALNIFSDNTSTISFLKLDNGDSLTQVYSAINSIEAMMRKILEFSGVIYDYYSEGITNIAGVFKGGLLAVVLILVFGFYLLYFTFIFAYALFALHVYFALMPIMLAFYPFKVTRPTFNQWIKSVFNYLTIPVLASIALGITTYFMNDSIYKMTRYLDLKEDATGALMEIYIPLILVGFIGYMILLRVGDMASHLTGGASTGLGADFSRTMNMFANTVTAVSAGAGVTYAVTKAGASSTKDIYKRLRGE